MPALEEDLAYYFGSGWRNHQDVVACSACTQEYVDRIREVGASSPNLLVAHAYTRYLGDLSGGQVLMRVAKKAMQLPADGRGTAFYRFPAMKQSARQFKKQYRLLLDGIKVKPEDADLIVAEANLAFVMNMRCFEELDVVAGDAEAVRPLAAFWTRLRFPSRGAKSARLRTWAGPTRTPRRRPPATPLLLLRRTARVPSVRFLSFCFTIQCVAWSPRTGPSVPRAPYSGCSQCFAWRWPTRPSSAQERGERQIDAIHSTLNVLYTFCFVFMRVEGMFYVYMGNKRPPPPTLCLHAITTRIQLPGRGVFRIRGARGRFHVGSYCCQAP